MVSGPLILESSSQFIEVSVNHELVHKNEKEWHVQDNIYAFWETQHTQNHQTHDSVSPS